MDNSQFVLGNGKWTCIYVALFQCTDHSKRFTTLATFTHSYPHSYTDGGGCHASCQLHIRSNLGFSILLKDTLTCSSAQPGGAWIRTFQTLDDPLYPMSFSRIYNLVPPMVLQQIEGHKVPLSWNKKKKIKKKQRQIWSKQYLMKIGIMRNWKRAASPHQKK